MIKQIWALALFAGNEQLFSRLIDLLHFTCIFSLTFLQVKQKASRMEFRFRAKSGNKTFDEPSLSYGILSVHTYIFFKQFSDLGTFLAS